MKLDPNLRLIENKTFKNISDSKNKKAVVKIGKKATTLSTSVFKFFQKKLMLLYVHLRLAQR